MDDEALDAAFARASCFFEPPPSIDLAAWIEANVELPEGMTDSPGLVRLWPYQRGIADAISDPEVERITVVKSARLGYTTLLTGMIASYVVNTPSQILVVLPKDDDCRDYMVSELEPVFAASPTLRGKLSDDADPNGRNTILSRRFPGGSIKLIGAKSPRNLRRHSARVLIIDEAAAMEADAGEGDVISRAIARTTGFADRKIIEGSTLTDDTSNVLRTYANSNRARFEVPCPACGGFTFMEWKHIEWEEGRPETAAFRCPHCEALVTEEHKPAMVAAARWHARSPEVRRHYGFHINALVSPLKNARWGVLAAEFLEAKDNPDLLKPFVNNVLAEPWTGDVVSLDENDLAGRGEPFGLNVTTTEGEPRAIPAEVLAVTLGTDVQDDRLEVSVVGWSETEAFVLDHVVLWGSPDDNATWAEHDGLVRTTWRHPLGGVLKVDAACVDSGDGDWTEQVYAYCRPRVRQNVLAIKGVGGNRPVIQRSDSKAAGGRLYILGVDGIKTTIMNRLERGRSIRFSDTLQPVYFEQLTSERKVLTRSRGQPRRMWDRKPGARAETLDCLVYAFAARQHLRLNFDYRRADMAGEEPVAALVPRSPKEQAELIRFGTINGVPVVRAAESPIAAAPLPAVAAPRSPREPAEAALRARTPVASASDQPMPIRRPRSPREQAEYNRSGTIGGVPVHPQPPMRLRPPPPPPAERPKPTTWGGLLKKG